MKIHELIELLSNYPDDAEVRLMEQARYPLEHAVRGVVSRKEMIEAGDETALEPTPVVFIVEGSQLGYGSKTAWDLT